MKNIQLWFILCLMTTASFAQETDKSSEFANSITAREIKGHISYLADDLIEGRETGERGQKLAGLYIKTQMIAAGLSGGIPGGNEYFQTFYLNRSGVNEATISVGKKTFLFKEDFSYFGSGLPPKLQGELVFAGHGIVSENYNNLKGLEVKDKIAVIFSGGPDPDADKNLLNQLRTWRNRIDAFEEAGAKGMLLILPDSVFNIIKRYAGRGRTSITKSEAVTMAGIYISETMANYMFKLAKVKPEQLQAELATNEKPRVVTFKKANFKLDADVESSVKSGENVLAYLEGTDKKDEVIVITAHYDHIGINRKGEINNGADDDASGTSAVMEIAEAFALAAREGYRPRRSLLFMLVSGEEKGLLGSDFYTQNPVYPLENTVANLNIDMVGRIDKDYLTRPDSTNYVYIIGSDRLSSELHEISERTNKKYSQITFDYKFNTDNDPNRFYYRSDHYNFAKNGIPVIFYFNGSHPDYHKPTDTVEKIKFGKIEKIARQVFYTAWELANREERIVVDKPVER